MGSKKKRSKGGAIRLDENTKKNRRVDQLREIFNAPGNMFDEATNVVAIPSQPTSSAVTRSLTATPTPTVPTQATDAHVQSAPARAQEATSLRTVIANDLYRPARRVDLAAKERDRKTEWWLGPALIFGALAMFGLAWLHIQRTDVVNHPVGHRSSTLEAIERETRAKVDYYRQQLGHRLNRDRVNVEILNSRLAPKIDASEAPVVERSMMSGVPMMQENYVRQNYGEAGAGGNVTSRDRTEPVPVDRPDARIQYGLQEEQHREEYDRRVQKAYIREFVENARRDGVEVILDADSNVVSVRQLGSGERLSSGRTPGSSGAPTR